MLAGFRAWLTRRRFERAFAAELRRIDDERAHHANVRQAQAILHERVNDALRRGLSA